ncbi:MAG TPA: bifunctional nuclease family protein [bacterium]|nr:bifunctional nuclease family protein [bacterium]
MKLKAWFNLGPPQECARRTPMQGFTMIEMTFFELRLDETGADQIIILKEKDGDRLMPILIGYYEAQSIHLAINDVQVQRPLTHDLIVNIIDALNARIIRILINQLLESTFYARIFFETPTGPVDVDSRPSDAIAIALRTNVPIFVAEEVLEQVAR